MKIIKYICLTALALQLFLICFANRALFTSRFDAPYWKDKYEHSQWKLPLSTRTLGDDGLYLYEGYRLIHRDDPTTLNAEVPPLGKYLIGLSILLFGNGYVFGFVVTLLSMLACFWFFLAASGNITISLVGITLLALDPLITQQFALTMLDSLQLLFFALFLGSLTTYLRVKNNRARYFWSIVSGVSIGFFAATKFPILAPVFAGIAVALMWKSHKKMLPISFFITSAAVAYLTPYIPYFLQHHSFLDWIRVQKWILAFYLKSGLAPTVGSVFTTLLVGKNQNLFTHAYESVSEWSPVWPYIMIASVVGFTRILQTIGKKHDEISWWPAIACFAILIIFYTVIPFWTRYLVILLPLLYLGGILMLKKVSPVTSVIIVVLLLSTNFVFSLRILFPTPKSTVNQFLTDWKHGAFQDMYEATSLESQRLMTRTAFNKAGKEFFYDAQVEDVEFSPQKTAWNIFKKSEQIPVTVTYKTRGLGAFDTTIRLPVVKQAGLWKIVWQWDLLFPKLTLGNKLETTIDPSRRGSIFTKDSRLLVGDIPSVLVWLLPDRVSPMSEDELFLALEGVFEKHMKAVHIHERYVRFGDLRRPVPIGVIMRPIDQETQKILTSYPAIMTTPAFGRMISHQGGYDIGTVENTLFPECCSFLYTTTAYDGVSGLEQQYNQTLKGINGGTLVVKDKNGETVSTLIITKKQDGIDVKMKE